MLASGPPKEQPLWSPNQWTKTDPEQTLHLMTSIYTCRLVEPDLGSFNQLVTGRWPSNVQGTELALPPFFRKQICQQVKSDDSIGFHTCAMPTAASVSDPAGRKKLLKTKRSHSGSGMPSISEADSQEASISTEPRSLSGSQLRGLSQITDGQVS